MHYIALNVSNLRQEYNLKSGSNRVNRSPIVCSGLQEYTLIRREDSRVVLIMISSSMFPNKSKNWVSVRLVSCLESRREARGSFHN